MADLPSVQVEGLYVHVPFCFHKCHYCDFYSITRQSPRRLSGFVDLVLAEAQGWADGHRGPVVGPTTIFFGGGTPSLLPSSDMRRLLLGLRDRFELSRVQEWTVECNPATVSAEYAEMLRECGVNRLSFGAQSFDPRELRVLERHHDPADVPRSIELARAAGFRRLNVDLIYAVPGQGLDSWRRSLDQALGLGTEHLSCYGLTYESNTPMAVRKRLGLVTAVDERIELQMLHETRGRLAGAGYRAYEISNYARAGAECRHNLMYWEGGNYIGLGPSAASHVQGWRWKNRAHLGEWELAVMAGGVPATEAERLTPWQRAGELVMLQLRLARGVRFADVENRTGVDPRERYRLALRHLSGIGLIDANETGFALTERGIDVADAVAAEFVDVG
jgi:oxygen-independent coproporphyrinogen-3 oxidase